MTLHKSIYCLEVSFLNNNSLIHLFCLFCGIVENFKWTSLKLLWKSSSKMQRYYMMLSLKKKKHRVVLQKILRVLCEILQMREISWVEEWHSQPLAPKEWLVPMSIRKTSANKNTYFLSKLQRSVFLRVSSNLLLNFILWL